MFITPLSPPLTPPRPFPHMSWILMWALMSVFVNMRSAVEFFLYFSIFPSRPRVRRSCVSKHFFTARLHCCHLPQCTLSLMKDQVRINPHLMSRGCTGKDSFNRSVMSSVESDSPVKFWRSQHSRLLLFLLRHRDGRAFL